MANASLEGADFGDFVSIAAIIISLFSTWVSISSSQAVARGEFVARERLKGDIASLLSALRTIMAKGAMWSQAPKDQRADLFRVDPELKVVTDIVDGTTGFALRRWAAEKSRLAKGRGEKWRVFFLEIAQLCQPDTPYHAARSAAKVEAYFKGMTDRDLTRIASYLKNLPASIVDHVAGVKDDVLAAAFKSQVEDEERENELFLPFVESQRAAGVVDPDLDVFSAAASGDMPLLESASKRGANLQVTKGEIIARYKTQWDAFVQQKQEKKGKK